MDDLIPTAAAGLALTALAVGFLWRDRGRRKERARSLMDIGFVPCGNETETLVERVTFLENSPVYRYSVDRPMMSRVRGKACYVYTKLRMQRTRIDAAEEMLVTVPRPSDDGLLLLIETGDPPVGSAKKWGEARHPGVPEWQPGDLVAIDVPHVDQGGLVAGFGPCGAALDDLIPMEVLEALGKVGASGVATITFRGSWCSFTAPSPRTRLDVVELMSLVEALPEA